MPRTGSRSTLANLVTAHRALEACMHRLTRRPLDVLVQGRALLAFAEAEEVAPARCFALLEPSVRDELLREHGEFAEDLDLLDWLVRTTPDSPDTATLADSLATRMRRHVERDGRLLQRAQTMAGTQR